MSNQRVPWLITVPVTSGVYILYAGAVAIYVGSSINLFIRLRGHQHRGKFDSFSWEAFPPSQLEDEEQRLVTLLNPPLNIKPIARPRMYFYGSVSPFDLRRKRYAPEFEAYTAPAVTSGRVTLAKAA